MALVMPLKDHMKQMKNNDDLRFMQLMIAIGVIFMLTLGSVIFVSIFKLW